jgi:hypothetical protein
MALKSRSGTITGTIVLSGTTTEVSATAWRADLLASNSKNPGGNNNFESADQSVSGSLISGDYALKGMWTNVPSALYNQYKALPAHLPYDTNAGQRLIAMTNPGRPDVKVPVFLAELRDIPEMVRDMGHLAMLVRDKHPSPLSAYGGGSPTAGAAKLALLHQFGWRPFLEDILKMADFQDSVEKRKKELKGLGSKDGKRRTVKNLQTVSKSSLGIVTVDNSFVNLPYFTKTTTVVSGGVIWKETYPGSSDLSDWSIRRLVTGFDAGNIAANVWEALPWTWFTDYFNNIGQQLQAGNRTIASPSRAWIKIRTISESTHPSKKVNKLICGSGNYRMRLFTRVPYLGGSSAYASLPFLGSGQLSTLGSLAVVKNRKVLTVVR